MLILFVWLTACIAFLGGWALHGALTRCECGLEQVGVLAPGGFLYGTCDEGEPVYRLREATR